MAVRLGELLLREKRVTPAQLQEALNHQRANGGRLGTSLVKLGIPQRRGHHRRSSAASTACRPINLARVRSRPGGRPADSRRDRRQVQRHSRRPHRHDADARDDGPDQRLRDGRHQVHDGPARRAGRRVRDRDSRRDRAALRRSNGQRARRRNGGKAADLVNKALEDLGTSTRRRPRGRRRRRGDRRRVARAAERRSADHPAGQRADAVGDSAGRERHPHRAVREGHADPVPHRRRAAGGDDAAAQVSATRSSRASRSWRGSTSPRSGCRRTAASRRASTTAASSREIDFRVSCCRRSSARRSCSVSSTPKGLRLDMTQLGFDAEALARFERAIRKPWGMVLVTGPTGSGKTNTLYSALAQLNQPGVNIMTAEDPVEFNLPGINQVQVREQHRPDVRRARCARSCGRTRTSSSSARSATPRPRRIAVKAALTGHLVLSTLHTNDAPSSINRLVNMGIEPFLVANSSTSSARSASCAASARTARSRTQMPADAADRGRARPGAKLPTVKADAGPRLRALRRHRLQGPRRPVRDHGDDRSRCATRSSPTRRSTDLRALRDRRGHVARCARAAC